MAIAKEMPGTPVKLIWSREEDMLHGRYHPITQCKLVAGLDKDNNVTALHMRISGQSILAGVFPQNMRNGLDPVVFQGLNPPGPEASIGYSFPNLLVDHAMRNPPVPPGFWRGVNLNQNTIYLECFLDEIAAATKQDPLALRRKLMASHPKHLAVLNAVADKVGWDKPAPRGVYRGLAQTMGFGSYVAACAEVSVNDAGELKIHRIVAATDCGHAVNPQQIEAQVEGSFVVRPVGGAVPRMHAEGRPHRADQLRHLPDAADEGHAQGRDAHQGLGRLLGRRRRADHRGGGAGGAERDLRGHRQAHPRPAAEEPQPEEGLIGCRTRGRGSDAVRWWRRWPHGRRCRPRTPRPSPTCAGLHDRRRRHSEAADDDAPQRRARPAHRHRTGRRGCACCATAGRSPKSASRATWPPDLAGTGSRWSEAQLRLRLVDASRLNPQTIMPSYYRTHGLERVGWQ